MWLPYNYLCVHLQINNAHCTLHSFNFFFQGCSVTSGKHIIRNLQMFPDPPEIPNLSSVPQLLQALPPKEMFHTKENRANVQSLYDHQVATRTQNCTTKHFVCLQCPCWKMTKSAIEGHVKRVHLQLQPEKCTCGYETFNTQCFRHHEKNCGKFVFCEMCGFKTICKWRLSRHQIRHKPNQNVSCGSCGKIFKYRSNMLRHKRLYCRKNSSKPLQYTPSAPQASQ